LQIETRLREGGRERERERERKRERKREREREREREGEGRMATLPTGREAGKKCGGTIVGLGRTHNL